MRALLAFLALGSSSICLAQTTTPKREMSWRDVCDSSKKQPLTPIEPSGPLRSQALATCDETKLYYGLGESPDYAGALQCGWYQRGHPQNTRGNMFYGPGVLAMLYANGHGVPRNYELAIRFACEIAWAADAENQNRVGHLEQLRDTQSQETKFDLCDDITSGLSHGTCTRILTRTAAAVRERNIAAVLKKLPPLAAAAFPFLRSAQTAFEKARVANEIDLSGTSRGALQFQEESELGDQFLANLRQFGSSDLPAASADDLVRLDRELNDVYQRIQNAPATKWRFGTITQKGIRGTERKWLALVDAWMVFARTAYTKGAATRIRGQLLRLRLQQLRSLADT